MIDRCNVDATQRAEWVRLAGEHGAISIALHLDVATDVCLQRARERTGHKTLPPNKAGGVVRRCARELQLPCASEGFDAVLTSSTIEGASAGASAGARGLAEQLAGLLLETASTDKSYMAEEIAESRMDDAGRLDADDDACDAALSTSGMVPALLACAPSAHELEQWRLVAHALRKTVERVLPRYSISVVGSVASGLALSGSDLDVELCATTDVGCDSGGDDDEEVLQLLASTLMAEGMQHCEVVITRSKAPSIVKYRNGLVHVDVSLSKPSSRGESVGAAKARFVRAQSSERRVRVLQVCFSRVLKRRGLHRNG